MKILCLHYLSVNHINNARLMKVNYWKTFVTFKSNSRKVSKDAKKGHVYLNCFFSIEMKTLILMLIHDAIKQYDYNRSTSLSGHNFIKSHTGLNICCLYVTVVYQNAYYIVLIK